MTRVAYDCEFLEDGRTIELISIGLVDDDGREYYAVNSAVDDSLNEGDLGRRISRHVWLMENVVPHLPLRTAVSRYTPPDNHRYMPPNLDMRDTRVKPKWVIANEVREFLQGCKPEIELWANYCAYDHVCLAQLFGTMMARPESMPMFTCDLQHELRRRGNPPIPPQESTEHNALADARHVRDVLATLDP